MPVAAMPCSRVRWTSRRSETCVAMTRRAHTRARAPSATATHISFAGLTATDSLHRTGSPTSTSTASTTSAIATTVRTAPPSARRPERTRPSPGTRLPAMVQPTTAPKPSPLRVAWRPRTCEERAPADAAPRLPSGVTSRRPRPPCSGAGAPGTSWTNASPSCASCRFTLPAAGASPAPGRPAKDRARTCERARPCSERTGAGLFESIDKDEPDVVEVASRRPVVDCKDGGLATSVRSGAARRTRSGGRTSTSRRSVGARSPGVARCGRPGGGEPPLPGRGLRVPDRHRHPGSDPLHRLGHRVLPLALTAAAHDDEAAVTGLEPVGRGRRATAAEEEPAPCAERHRGDERAGHDEPVPVAVPGDAVGAVAVEVHPDAVEVDAVAL